MITNKIKLSNVFRQLFFSIALLVLVMFGGVKLNGQTLPANPAAQNPQGNQAARPAQPASVLRAPDVLPGTLPEMRTPAYWIARMSNPDAVVLSASEIQKKNKTYLTRMGNFSKLDSLIQKQINAELKSRPGLMTSIPDMTTKTQAEISEFVNTSIDRELAFLNKGRNNNILGIPYAPWEIQQMADEISYAKAPEQIKLTSAITVKDCRLRIIPQMRTEYVSSSANWDMWNFDIIPISTPVSILSMSKSGGFLFVLCEKGFGWVNAEDVAIGVKEQIDNFCNSKDFIVCTGDKVPYYADSTCTLVSGYFRMGDHLGQGDSKSPRTVLVPVRLINGKLSLQEAWVKRDADVSRGYLPYTRKNIVTQTFKLLDNIYDWTGGWMGRDHATQLRDIFSTFGFKWPSMGGLLSAYQPIEKIVYHKDGHDAQIKAILANDPFTTIQICATGHAQLFLGNYNGVPILFDTHGYRYDDPEGNTFMIRRANVGTQALPDYFLSKDAVWFLELK